MPGAYLLLHSPRSPTVGTREALGFPVDQVGTIGIGSRPHCGSRWDRRRLRPTTTLLAKFSTSSLPGESGVMFWNHPNAHGVNTGGLQAPLFKLNALWTVIGDLLLIRYPLKYPEHLFKCPPHKERNMTETSPIALVSLGQQNDNYLLPGASAQHFFGFSKNSGSQYLETIGTSGLCHPFKWTTEPAHLKE